MTAPVVIGNAPASMQDLQPARGRVVWVEAASTSVQELFGAIQSALPTDVLTVVAAWPEGGNGDALRSAELLTEVALGVIQSAQFELGAATNVNLVLANAGQERDVRRTLAYLHGPHGGFAAGCQFDLRSRAASRTSGAVGTALVTGAGGGLGSAAVRAFAAAGWRVVATDRIPGPWTEQMASDGERGHTAVIGEIGAEQWLREVEDATSRGGLHAVVAAHGIEGTGSLSSLTPERVDQVMTVNFTTVTSLYDALRPRLQESAGVFVAVSSQAGLQGEPSSTAYCASKFGLVAWMRSQHRVDEDVRFRTLCPGATVTPLLKQAFEGWAAAEGVTYEDIMARRSAAVPVGRLGKPDDIGHAALWLAELATTAHVIAPVTGGEVVR